MGLARPAPAPESWVIQGRAIALPVVVRDATSVTATYVVAAEAVRRLIPARDLHVAEIWPGRAVCVLVAVEYRDNDLGQYLEFGVNFFVTRGGSRPRPLVGMLGALRRGTLGVYVHRLPVTTSFSCEAGRDIWGFPKTVEDIRIADDGGRRVCTLSMDGAQVLTLAVTRGGGRRMRATPQRAFAWRDGVLYETRSTMQGEGVGMRFGGATLTLGTHPVADELRGLGLPKRALMTTSFERMAATFAAPVRC